MSERKYFDNPHDALRYHVSGAIERGEGEAVTEVRQQWIVIENTPGYMPDDDGPPIFEDLGSAKQYLQEEVERYIDFLVDGCETPEETPESEIFLAWWSEDLTSAHVTDPTRIYDLGRSFTIHSYDREG